MLLRRLHLDLSSYLAQPLCFHSVRLPSRHCHHTIALVMACGCVLDISFSFTFVLFLTHCRAQGSVRGEVVMEIVCLVWVRRLICCRPVWRPVGQLFVNGCRFMLCSSPECAGMLLRFCDLIKLSGLGIVILMVRC